MADLFVMERHGARLQDASARADALDVRRSWIVEAPAGSGKTGLLIQRYLKLLATTGVERPEQVLAITFTEKATAEMRERVLEHLRGAAAQTALRDAFDGVTRALAEAVLEKDAALGWGLVDAPGRLNIRTIHSLSASIAGALPVLSGSGGRLRPVADALGLYHDAARRTLMQLGGADTQLDAALRLVLLHRDGNLGDVERLVAGMLERREQWDEVVALARAELEESYLDGEVRRRLERALEVAICATLSRAATAIPPPVLGYLSMLAGELGGAEGYKGGANPLAICRVLREAPGETVDDLDHWIGLAHLLLTKDGDWRKGLRGNWLKLTIDDQQIARLKTVLDELSENDEALAAIRSIGNLPPAKYPEEQWAVTKALFRMLRTALVELQQLFAQRGECDFAELERAAKAAMRSEGGVHDLAETLGLRMEHLLVDEMQDTSSGQYELIELLTAQWDGRTQTVFLVGDPKQSIYLFRQARVERFLRAMRTGRIGGLNVGRLRLTANFRSQAGLVRGFNEDFSRMFPTPGRDDGQEVTYSDATATREEYPGEGRTWHAAVLPYIANAGEAKRARQRQTREDAREIRRVVEAWRGRPLREGRTKAWTMAVLVRGREHLADIMAAFKEGAVPYRAVEIEALKDRQIVLDLVAITRALLHPADRVAWLAVLHAPWCGLGLADMHMLAGADDAKFAETCIEDLMVQRGHLLSPDGIARLERLWPTLRAATRQRERLTSAQWVERTWRSLGGDAYATETELSEAGRYLRLLDEIETECGVVDIATLDRRLGKLYADTATCEGAVDLMTIHGAKGLEWDVVMVPALQRSARRNRGGLLTWLELDSSEEDAAHVVLAPIESKGSASKELREWIASVHKERDAEERKRLFYVACTRAREALHLFAARGTNAKGQAQVAGDSLLAAAWTAAEDHFPPIGPSAGQASQPIAMEQGEEEESFSIAAAGEAGIGPPKLYRVPLDFDSRAKFVTGQVTELEGNLKAAGKGFARPEGSYAARAIGNAIHGFAEPVTGLFAQGLHKDRVLSEIAGWESRIEAVLRGDGLPPAAAQRLAARVLQALRGMVRDPVGGWVLQAREGAASEYALTTWGERRTTVRVDRMFRAGNEPLAEGADCLWIVDYKTGTHGREGIDAFLDAEKEKYRGQMEAYARALAREDDQVRLGLYFPSLARLVWWRAEAGDG